MLFRSIGSLHFSAVNLSVLLPLPIVLYNYYKVAAQNPKSAVKMFRSTNKKQIMLTTSAVVLIIVYYIIRNGKSSLILPFEYNLRTYLTDIFYVRPRFKEFLMGYPAFTMFLYLSVYKEKSPVFWAVLQTVLFTSILNTFCHAATPYFTSVQRMFNGFLCHLLSLGIMVIVIKTRKVMLKEKNKEKNNLFY